MSRVRYFNYPDTIFTRDRSLVLGKESITHSFVHIIRHKKPGSILAGAN
jgi:N-dimethylarginine dimethylaminohydrolase